MTPDDELRALTVKQPLAWAIIAGHKDVENRSWRFPLPLGTTVAIHAGRKVVDGLPVALDVPEDFPRGAVVGFADVVGDHHADECSARCSPWAYPETRHWVLRNARALAYPEPTRGYLWLFVPPPDVTARLIAALRG
jgi:hypothetical protein